MATTFTLSERHYGFINDFFYSLCEGLEDESKDFEDEEMSLDGITFYIDGHIEHDTDIQRSHSYYDPTWVYDTYVVTCKSIRFYDEDDNEVEVAFDEKKFSKSFKTSSIMPS